MGIGARSIHRPMELKYQPRTIEWVTNKDGFRGESEEQVSDVVLLGDSFIEYGDSEAQTFGKILEQQLDGRTVTNFGISGYAPFHYLEVLQKIRTKKKNPKLSVFLLLRRGTRSRYSRIYELEKRQDGGPGRVRVNIKDFYTNGHRTGWRNCDDDPGYVFRGSRDDS